MVGEIQYNGKRKKEKISITINEFHLEGLDKLVDKEIYDSGSQIIREALSQFLSSEYNKALLVNQERIYKEIIKSKREGIKRNIHPKIK